MKPLIHVLLASTLLLGTLPAMAQTSQAIQAPFQLAQAAPAGQPISMDHTHFTLPNGLNVYLSRNPLEPRFYAQVVVNAGGKMDPDEATGIAHYLEHMLFKGTDEIGTADFAQEKTLQDQIVATYDKLFAETDAAKRTVLLKQINDLTVKSSQYAIPGELDSLYSRLGGEGLNAFTSNEETAYLVSLPKNRLEQWAMVESERFKDPVFRLFQSELEAVYEEKNRSLDNKEEILSEAVEAQLYKKHPYGAHTILGTIPHLKNPSLNKMYEFYRTYYVPNNMALVISGDIDIAQTRKIIEKYFSGWQSKPVPPYQVPQEPPIQGVERVKVQYKGEEKVLLAFRTAARSSADRTALRMIDMLLDSGQAGLIKLNLVQTQMVREAGSYPNVLKDYGAQFLWAVPKEGQSLEEVEKLLLDQLEKIKRGEFDESIMQAIALDFENGQKRTLESNEGRVGIMADAFLNGESVEVAMGEPAKMRALTKAKVVEVAKRYFGSSYVAGQRLDAEYSFPPIDKPVLGKMQLNPNQTSAFVKRVEAIKPPPVEPEWIDPKKAFKADSYAPGVVFHYNTNPINDLFNFTISYDYGDKHYPSFCTVMSELNHAGTGSMSADDVTNAFYKLGVSASYSCGDYGFALNLQGADASFEKALTLSEQVLWAAKLDSARFKAKLENMLSNREDEKKDAATLRQALRGWVRYGNESGFIDRPTAAELRQISVAQYPLMAEALQKQNFDIYYTGRMSMQQVEALVRKHHKPQDIPIPLLHPRQQPPLELLQRHNKPVKIYFLHNPGAQSSIDLMIPEPQVNPTEAVVETFYNQYMDGGMGAIMFQEVRESRALAYSTWAYYATGSRLGDQDQMLAYIGTQADKTVEALTLLIDLMRNPPKAESHFNRARQSLDNAYRTSRVSFREVFGTMQGWADMGYDTDPRPLQFGQLSHVQMEDLYAFIQKRIAGQPLTFTIVGDRAKVNLPALQKLGEVEEIKPEQLFKD
ncbi:MAG: M16 family metallopeptidase [Candidatus Sericytochromatia bacterium]